MIPIYINLFYLTWPTWLFNLVTGQLDDCDDCTFWIHHYIPELQEQTKDVSVSLWDSITLLRMFAGLYMKLIFAFLYQELFVPADWMHGYYGMHFGVFIMPIFNEISNMVSGITQTDPQVGSSYDLYPGHSTCKYSSPHALWHEESANGFVELLFIAD